MKTTLIQHTILFFNYTQLHTATTELQWEGVSYLLISMLSCSFGPPLFSPKRVDRPLRGEPGHSGVVAGTSSVSSI